MTKKTQRAPERRRPLSAAGLALAAASALFACAGEGPSEDEGGSGRGGASAGASTAGSAGSGSGGPSTGGGGGGGRAGAGVAGSTAGSSGSAGTAGSGGQAGNAGGTAGTAAGAPAGASGSAAGGASNTGGAGGGGLAGKGGGAGSGGASGGSAGNGGASGSGGSGGEDDRCDIANAGDTPPASLTLSGNLGTHDPVVIFAHDRFYLFSTGDQLGAKTSTDLRSWQAAPEVFSGGSRPQWIANQVPGATNLWAPDIAYFGGKYHLYYSASTFGCNVSCIGHASRAALDSGSWTDHGSIICSNPGASCEGRRPDDYNAIDPNVVIDRDGKPWLSFGSFWGGLKMFELDQNGDRVGNTLHSIAARPQNSGALEAPFIVRRCGYYYLFLSWDTCCQGANSTYNIRVGRAEAVTGPYVDKAGTPLMQGGGTLVLQGNTRWRGPGHNAVLFTDDGAFNVYHAYDANNNGAAVLRISELVWDEQGWPISGGP